MMKSKVESYENFSDVEIGNASHTSFKNLKNVFTQRDIGKQGSKKVDKMGESLIRENLILSKSTG